MGKALEYFEKIKNVNINFKRAHKIEVEPKQLNKLIKELSRRVNTVKDIPERQNLEKFFQKTKKIYVDGKGNLTSRERRNLPFILSASCTIPGMLDFVFAQIDFRKFTSFKRSLFVYFSTYGDKQIMPRLRDELLAALADDTRKSRISYLGHNAELLRNNGPQKMAAYFKNSLQAYFESISFPIFLQHSRFVNKAIIYYFKDKKFNLEDKMQVIDEIVKDEAYKVLIPKIAGDLILEVNDSGNPEYREKLLFVLHREMGDPRYSNRQVSWSNVCPKAQDIFISWLKRGDLELFFAIIDRTMFSSLSYSVDARAMWLERKQFWERYLDKMYYTKVILAPEAVSIVKREYPRKVLDYGRLNSSNRNQSLFVFSIGNYVFSEASYNGTLRIWRLKSSPITLDEELRRKPPIDYSYDIVHTYNEVETFVHSGYWQGRVSAWIQYHCQ